MTIEDNLIRIRSSLPVDNKLIAVSKTKSNEAILEAYGTGQRLFGENKVQELLHKWETLPKDIEWHFIGHLQSNKVRYISSFIAMIHSVDSFKILKSINDEAKRVDRIIPVLLQIYIATEETKFGFSAEEAFQMLHSSEMMDLKNVRLCGVMGMATYTDDEELINNEFSNLQSIFQKLKECFFKGNDHFCEISMGMSNDYHLAIKNGSTMVRVGSHIFGER